MVKKTTIAVIVVVSTAVDAVKSTTTRTVTTTTTSRTASRVTTRTPLSDKLNSRSLMVYSGVYSGNGNPMAERWTVATVRASVADINSSAILGSGSQDTHESTI